MKRCAVITIVLASSKGGAGKSTLSVHLAVAALRGGHKTAIIDADPQASSVAWSQARESDEPYVIGLDPADVPKAITEAADDGVEILLIDTQPRAAASLTRILERADFALIPVRPSPLDLATGAVTQRIVAAARIPFAFVINAAPARSREVIESRATLGELGDVFDTTIGDRRIYSRSLQTGRSCQEFEPTSDAAGEIERAWHELSRRANVVQTRIAQA